MADDRVLLPKGSCMPIASYRSALGARFVLICTCLNLLNVTGTTVAGARFAARFTALKTSCVFQFHHAIMTTT